MEPSTSAVRHILCLIRPKTLEIGVWGPQKSHPQLPSLKAGRVSLQTLMADGTQVARPGTLGICAGTSLHHCAIQRPPKYLMVAEPWPPPAKVKSAPSHPADVRRCSVTKLRRGKSKTENPRCEERTPAHLLKWVLLLQGGSEDVGSCHHEEALLWSVFLGTEIAANPNLCHHPEHHHAPVGTAQEEAAVSTGHSPIPSTPKCSCPTSYKKQGHASTLGAPLPPCQLLSQLPPPQTRARVRLGCTGVQQDETRPPQNPSCGPKECVLVGKQIPGTSSNNRGELCLIRQLGAAPSTYFLSSAKL